VNCRLNYNPDMMQPVHLVKKAWKKSRRSAQFRYIWQEPPTPYFS